MGTRSGHGQPGEKSEQNPLIKLEPIDESVPEVPENIVNVYDYDSHFVVVEPKGEPDLSSTIEQSSVIKGKTPTTETECGVNIKQEPSQDEETCPEDILHTHNRQPVVNSNIPLSCHTPLVKQEKISPVISYRVIIGTNNEISLIKVENKNSQIVTHNNDAVTNCDYNITISNTTSTQTRIRPRKKIYACDECDHRTPNKFRLEKHKLTHSSQKRHECQFCDYKGLTARNLKRHMVRHTKDSPYTCEHCDYACSQRGLLVQHIRTHTGEKPFSCKYCNYKCAAISNLKSHLAIHNGIRRHYCHHCGFKFLRSESLKNHILRLHKNRKERPIGCHHCSYKCVTKSEITRHLRIHFR